MIEHPIIFSTDMVKAILDGRKTMTRRVIKHPERYEGIRDCDFCCPYGQVGDRLWVRETFTYYKMTTLTNELSERITYKADKEPFIWQQMLEEKSEYKIHPAIFMPRWASRINLEITKVRVEGLQEITREEFLKEGGWICCDGICGEGTKAYGFGEGDKIIQGKFSLNHRDEFSKLWNSINAKRGYSWESNPWVWVISFRRL